MTDTEVHVGVAAPRVEPAPRSARRVLLATDGSPDAARAARAALDLLGPDIDPILVTVQRAVAAAGELAGGIEGPLQRPHAEAAQRQQLRVESDSILAETARAVGDRPLSRQLVLEGSPGPALVDAAADLRADVIVLGGPSKGLVERMLVESVTHHVVQHAPCPVLLVPPAPQAEGGS